MGNFQLFWIGSFSVLISHAWVVFFVAFDILYTFPLLYGLHVGQLDIFQDCGSGACYNFPIWNKNDEAASIIYPFLIIIISFSAIPGPFQFYSNISWACHSYFWISNRNLGRFCNISWTFQLWINDITGSRTVFKNLSKSLILHYCERRLFVV